MDLSIPVQTEQWLFWLDLFGVVVFAISGTLLAVEKRMDFFGAIVLALVTAMGGGTVRDVLLDIHPIVWIRNDWYIMAAVSAALFTFFASRFIRFPHKVLLIADALGLGTFAVMGATAAMNLNMPPVIVVIMGVVTGTFGGVIRDMMCGQIPLVFQRDIYATPVLIGIAFLVYADQFFPDQMWVSITAASIIMGIRLIVIQWNIQLPAWLTGQMEPKK